MTSRLLTCLMALVLAFSGPDAAAQGPAATPVTLRHSVRNRVVTANVERGVRQVVLEQKTGPGWKPITSAYPPANLGRMTFRLSSDVPASDLRVLGYRHVKFPARFLRGKRSFDRKDLSATDMTLLGTVMSMHGSAVSNLVADSRSTTTSTQTVVESDIWQIVGSQVYFFNQYRGLQILDLTDPAAPARTGSLRLPASGEQMFVLDEAGTRLALLGRSNDKTRPGAATIWLIQVSDGVPAIVGEVPLDGAITDSRLIGSTLHVLCSVWPQSVSGTTTGEAVLTSIDLTNMESAAKLGTLRFPAHSAVLQAAGGHLLVATSFGTSNALNAQHRLHLVDISGSPRLIKTFTPRGAIQDKFKIGIVNDAVVAVTLSWPDWNISWNQRQTWVETFPVEGSTVTPMAALEIEGARGESLHATRLDGDRLYIVTFLQIDPLFIVDLANPAAPVLSGVLEVPGWSTYLEPLGDRLLAVGVEGRQVTVSLFDVADVTAPALLSRLPLGPENGYSWSEANYDEKAVEYLPEQGVVMVPFQTWWNPSGPEKAVQVVQVGADTLTAGPTIEHSFNPRRGSFIAGHYVTISGQELLIHRTDSPGEASPVTSLPLAWRADRVVPVGQHLVQIEDGPSSLNWGGFSLRLASLAPNVGHAMIRITSSSDPDALEQVIDLGEGQIVGQTQKDSLLFLAQWVSASAEKGQHLRTLCLDLSSAAPVVTEVGRVEHDFSAMNVWNLRLDATQGLWVGEDRLVWYVPTQPWRNWWWFSGPIMILPTVLDIAPNRTVPSANTSTGIILEANTASAAPLMTASPPGTVAAALCPVSLDDFGIHAETAQVVRVNGDLRSTSTAFTQGGFIFLSYDTATAQAAKPIAAASRRGFVSIIPYRPLDYRMASWLQVIDWRSTTPVLRDPVSIPGRLLSVAQADAQGAVILTNSDQQISTAGPATRVIQASAYDGVSAWQLDNYITSTPFHTPVATDGTRLYLVRDSGSIGVVGVGYNSVTGRLGQINSWSTAAAPSLLHVVSGHLLASSYGNLEVASIQSGTGSLKPVAAYDTPSNLWLRVDRTAFTASQDLWIPAGDFGVELLQHTALAP